MPNYISINKSWYILSDDPTNAAVEATAVLALANSTVTDSQVRTTVQLTDATVVADGTPSFDV